MWPSERFAVCKANEVYDQVYCINIHVCFRMYFSVLLQWLSDWLWPVLSLCPCLNLVVFCSCPVSAEMQPTLCPVPHSFITRVWHSEEWLCIDNNILVNSVKVFIVSILNLNQYPMLDILYCHYNIQFGFLKFLLLNQIRPWPYVFEQKYVWPPFLWLDKSTLNIQF